MFRKNKEKSDSQIAKLKRRIDSMREQIAEDDTLANGAESDLWKAVDSKLRKKLAQIENDLAEYGKLTHDQIIATLEAKNILLMVLALPGIATSTTKILGNEIQKCLREIAELEQRN